DDLQVENLRLQLELDRYKKWYYGPRADRLQSDNDLAQMLLTFAEELDRKPVHADDLPRDAKPEEELRRVKRRQGRRNLANFENLPVTTQVHELSAEERACPCCGVERKEIGADESWQVEYLPGHFERIHHVRKKYACPGCESHGDNPRMETAAKPDAAIDKGMAGPGTAGLHRHQQIQRLPAVVPAGRYFSAAGVRDLAGNAIGLVRRRGRPGRAAV
ncbi:transposase IS66, partial [mine drainage metagenome]